MTIAIVSAFKREVGPLLAELQGRRRLPGSQAWVGRLGPTRVVVAVVGMGHARASARLSRLLDSGHPALAGELDLIVSVGFAGALAPEPRLGDVVVADRVVTPGAKSWSCDATWVERGAALPRSRRGAVMAVKAMVRRPEEKRSLHTDPAWQPGPLVVDMESAAVAELCEVRGIPFMALKVVLDRCDEVLTINPATLPWLMKASRLASLRLMEATRVLLGDYERQTLLFNRLMNRIKPWVFGPLERDETPGRLKPLYPLHVEGYENLPTGGFILAFNHESWLDVCAVFSACPFRVRYMTKSELFELPVVGHLMRYEENIPVVRGTPDGLDQAIDALRSGSVVAIFPEGTIPGEEDVPRSAVLPETGLLKGKTGAVRLALAAGVPLVPVGISGTGEALPVEAVPHLKKPPIPKRGVPLKVTFGRALDLSDFQGRADDPLALREATDRLMGAISRLVEPASNVSPKGPRPARDLMR